jgi:L-threonylcarbamoyladenylate synthase
MKTEIGKNIVIASSLLSQGRVVAVPTETVYGLAANALDPVAVATIFEVKDRPFFDPLIVHCASVDRIGNYVEAIPSWSEELFKRFSPGPLTIVLKKKPVIPDIVTAGLDTVGIRIPNHPLTLELLQKLTFPLAAPSANPFGYVSPTTAIHVFEQLGGKIPYIVDGGSCAVGVESTIVAEISGRPTVLRLGGTSIESIEEVIGTVDIQTSSSQPAGPGMLDSHYAPKRKVILKLPDKASDTAGFMGFRNESSFIAKKHQRLLSPSGDLNEAARNIFSALRELDAMNVDIIYAELLPEVGLGRAVNDRLKRAAT